MCMLYEKREMGWMRVLKLGNGEGSKGGEWLFFGFVGVARYWLSLRGIFLWGFEEGEELMKENDSNSFVRGGKFEQEMDNRFPGA